MGFRSMGRFIAMTKAGLQLRGMATATPPKMKAATAELHHHQGHGHGGSGSSWRLKGEFTPVYVAVGMIALSMSLGLHTAKQQLKHAPNVSVRKRRRETLPEVAEPEHVMENAHEFLNNSFFRRVAHVQDPEHNYVVKDSTRRDAYSPTAKKSAVTLTDVGVRTNA